MKDVTERDINVNIPLTAKKPERTRSEVRVNDVIFGGSAVVVVAGPCTVENEGQIHEIAQKVKAAGARVLRGGAYKPLTFPYRSETMYELREDGLKFLSAAGKATGLPVVTEVMDVRLVDTVARYADMLQIGARSMQNFPLLEEIAKTKKPVLLKRHPGSSLRDWLGAAEYLLYNGNASVVLCERGIVAPHTHEPTSRFIVDLQVVPAAREYSHLPVIVDPSHATFKRAYVKPISQGAIAVGADGLILDVHPVPEKAAVDPLQGLNYQAFEQLMAQLKRVASAVDRTL
jgi:3-deoxy-7-phosphoheptulonate synthase